MSLLEAISPTARFLLKKWGGGRVNYITKADARVVAVSKHRVHIQMAGNKTRCGITLEPAQEDLAGPNCKRCLRLASTKQRAIKRLNGQRVSPNQIKLIA